MPITFRHDAAAVVPPSNQTTRKYGQQLVLQQNQQKYAAQQQGYDRLFTLGRDAMQSQNQAIMQGQQNAFQAERDINQNMFQAERDMARFEQQRKQQEAEQANKFMEEARKQSSGMIMDDIKNENYDPATSRKLQQNLVAESEALGNPQLDATQRAEALAKIRAERAMLTANRIEKPQKAPPQPNFHTDQNGNQWVEAGPGKWNQVPKEEKPPTSAAEAFQDPKVQKDFMEQAIAIETKGGEQPLDEASYARAVETARRLWDKSNSPTAPNQQWGGSGIQSSTIPPQQPASPGTERSILEQAPEQQIALGPGHPDYKAPPTPTGQKDAQGYVIMSDGSKVDPRDSAAMKSGGGMTQDVMRMTNPDGSSIEQSTSGAVEEMGASQKKQVKVGGKPLAVTPGALTPQETAARGQIMELPREQRIAALMPYEPSLKGKTLDQLLEDPETKAGYAELSKQGLTTGNYREDMLGHLDEMLQNNVLNGPGTKPDAYVGMNVNDIKDPKAKAELEKLPRPKSGEDMKTIRGSFFVDPNGVVRSTQKQV